MDTTAVFQNELSQIWVPSELGTHKISIGWMTIGVVSHFDYRPITLYHKI